MKRIYLDYAASTPVDPAVFEFMKPYFSEKYGNPGSLHSFGQEAIAAVDRSREVVAKAIGADFREIIFTGSATEANNLVLRGAIGAFRKFSRGTRRSSAPAAEAAPHSQPQDAFGDQALAASESFRPKTSETPLRIIISSIEHESILETAKDLEKDGIEVIYLPVGSEGFVDLEKLKESLNERTILVSVMYANNEVGTIQPIAKISEIVREFRKQKTENISGDAKNSEFYFLDSGFPLFHTDAVQAFQYLDCNVDGLGIDLTTLSAHKVYGPKGVGALHVRNSKFKARNSKQIPNSESQIQNVSDFGFRISDSSRLVKPIVTGGGQEYGFRSGTENVPAIAGFGKAVELLNHSRESLNDRIKKLRDYFWEGLKKIYPKAEVNGQTSNVGCLPNILNVYFPDHSANDLLVKLDVAGVAVSSGAACSARSSKPSQVLKALGMPAERILRSVRFSFGKFTTQGEVDEALKRIKILLWNKD